MYPFNLVEEELQRRFLLPYEDGTPITWDGRTLPGGDIDRARVVRTDRPVTPGRFGDEKFQVIDLAEDVTNDWILGPPGEAVRGDRSEEPGDQRDARRVMVVYGRNDEIRRAMFTFLRSLGLLPIEWEEAVAETRLGAPHNFDAVRAAMDVAQAVVVILTAEDRAGLLPSLAGPHDEEEVKLKGQPRQNVILEAGLAMGLDRSRTNLVEAGPIRHASDFDGLNAVRISNEPGRRQALLSRLKTAGCAVEDAGSDWMQAPSGGDFSTTASEERIMDESPQSEATEVARRNPYAHAAMLQRRHNLDRFLETRGGVDQPFSIREFAEAVGLGTKEAEAGDILAKLAEEGRVEEDPDSPNGWYPHPESG
jgi:predicted nucleotide-binding protein